jgi:hypothetical protein
VLLALVLVLAVVVLFSFQPWGPTSLMPPPKISPPEGEIGLSDATVVDPPRGPALEDARVVEIGGPTLEGPARIAEPQPPDREPVAELAVSTGQAVLVSSPTGSHEPPPQPAPVGAPPPSPPTLVPVVATPAELGPPGTGLPGPRTAVTEEVASIQVCEWEESESEIHLEGSVVDLHDLVARLVSEGDCEEIEADPPGPLDEVGEPVLP